jgi:predicted transcriptional regulator
MQTVNVDTLVTKFVELRDRKAKIEKDAEEAKKPLNELMDAIETKIKEELHAQGATSLKTPHGTAYLAYRESATVADWDALLTYIQREQQWDLLEHRVSKTTVKTLMEEDRNGEYQNPPPPGVNFTRFETINVRRS